MKPIQRQPIVPTNAGILLIEPFMLRNKLQRNVNRNTKLFINKIIFENVVCEMAAILFRGRWVQWNLLVIALTSYPYLSQWTGLPLAWNGLGPVLFQTFAATNAVPFLRKRLPITKFNKMPLPIRHRTEAWEYSVSISGCDFLFFSLFPCVQHQHYST